MFNNLLDEEVFCSTLNIKMNVYKHNRPKNLNLLKIRMPVTAVVSILHRVSGILLFLSIPYVVWLLSQSVKSEQGFSYVMMVFESDLGKLINIVLLWAISHHFFAGIRFLLLDLDVAIERNAALKMAWLVNACVLITLLILLYKVVI